MPGNILETENAAVSEKMSIFLWSLNSKKQTNKKSSRSVCVGGGGGVGEMLGDKCTKYINSEKTK